MTPKQRKYVATPVVPRQREEEEEEDTAPLPAAMPCPTCGNPTVGICPVDGTAVKSQAVGH